MSCAECGKEEYLLFACHHCGAQFCSDHRLPESHNCAGFRHTLKKHEQAWKHGKASVKYKSEYDGAWEDNVREINHAEEPRPKYTEVTNPCPNCGNQVKNHNLQCSVCGREFCSKHCANPKNHGCITKTENKQHKSFVLPNIGKINFEKIIHKIVMAGKELSFHMGQDFVMLILLFVISFFGFGLYFGDYLKTNLILAIILLGATLWIMKNILEERGRYTKVALILVVLLISFFVAQQYSVEVFENIGVNGFLIGLGSIFTASSSGQSQNLNSNISDSTILDSLSKTVDSTVNTASNTISDLTKPPDVSEIEQLIYQKTNELRQSKRLTKLTWHAQLAQIARAHSLDMGERNFFEHDNPDGDGPTERAQKAGISTRVDYGSYYTVGIGENISMVPVASNVIGCSSTYSEEGIAECAFDGWVNSPGHYANMIDGQYTNIGVGVAIVRGTAYLTQNFR